MRLSVCDRGMGPLSPFPINNEGFRKEKNTSPPMEQWWRRASRPVLRAASDSAVASASNTGSSPLPLLGAILLLLVLPVFVLLLLERRRRRGPSQPQPPQPSPSPSPQPSPQPSPVGTGPVSSFSEFVVDAGSAHTEVFEFCIGEDGVTRQRSSRCNCDPLPVPPPPPPPPLPLPLPQTHPRARLLEI